MDKHTEPVIESGAERKKKIVKTEEQEKEAPIPMDQAKVWTRFFGASQHSLANRKL